MLHDTPIHSFFPESSMMIILVIEFYIPPDMPCRVHTITAKAVVDVEGIKHTIVCTTQLNVVKRRSHK